MRGAPLLVLLAIVLRAVAAQAEEPLPLALEWEAPAGCAGADEIRAELSRIAHVRPGRVVSPLSARGRIEKSGDRYSLTLRTEQNGVVGERTLSSSECRSLEREVTLVLAVAFGEGVEIVDDAPGGEPGSESMPASSAVEGGADTKAAPAPAPVAEPSKPPGEPASPAGAADREQTERHRRRPLPPWRAAAYAGGGLEYTLLPSMAAFALAGLQLGLRQIWLEPRFIWFPGVDQSLERSVTARYEGISGGGAACLGLALAGTPAGACAGAEYTALRGRSSGATESGSATAPFGSATGSFFVSGSDRDVVTLRLELGLRVPLSRPRFVVDGLGEAHRVPSVSPSMSLSVVLQPFR